MNIIYTVWSALAIRDVKIVFVSNISETVCVSVIMTILMMETERVSEMLGY
jgi:hypothetical protein